MKKFKVPHTFVLIFSIVILMAIATYIVPAGQYDTVQGENGKELVVAGSYHQVEKTPQGLWSILKSPIRGIVDAAEIIAFILIIGGAFKIVFMSGAVNAAISRTARKLRGKEILVIPVMMLLFSAGGAVFGMAEETIPFIIVFVPLSIALGYDSIVGTAIPFVGSGLGFAGAMFNPFTVGIAQGIAELKPFSGVGYRTVCWIIVTVIGVIFVMLYARKIKKNPEKSPMYELDKEWKKQLPDFQMEEVKFTKSHKLVITAFALGMGLLVFGVLKWGWYIEEICALFLGIGIVCAILAKMNANKAADYFIEGAKDLSGAALIVGIARGILIIAKDGKIIDTILHHTAGLVEGVPHAVSSWLMFFVQTCINFFIPSGSGQAALTMPIMAPLGDLIGLKRQIVVLAYQFGDGFTNLIVPTSAVLLGCLMMAKIPWTKWARWILPLQIIFVILGCILLSIAVAINFS